MLIFLSWQASEIMGKAVCVIDGDYILQDFGGEDASYLSQENFEKLLSGDDEALLEVGLKSWCVVKLE